MPTSTPASTSLARPSLRRPALLLTGVAVTATGVLGGGAVLASAASSAGAAAALPHAEARYAVVNANGTLARGTSGTSSASTGLTGNYEVLFDRDVRSCAYTATIGAPTTAIANPGAITVAQRGGKPNGVFLTVKDVDGARQAQPFHLVVTC